MAATYYVNLTNGSLTGLGTSASPLNYAQLVNYFDSSFGTAHGVVVDYDSTFYLTGNLNETFNFSGSYRYFINYALPSAGTFKFIGLDGPVVIFSGTPQIHFITCKTTSQVVFSTTNLEFHNISLLVDCNDVIAGTSVAWAGGGPYPCDNLKFKNSYIKNPTGASLNLRGYTGELDLFGCTLDGVVVVGGVSGSIGNVKMYDCYIPGTLSFSHIPVLIAEGNASINPVTITSCPDITQYNTPVIVTQTGTLPALDSYLGAVDYFSSKDNNLYTNYDVIDGGTVYRGVSPNIRIPNDFVYDAYGDPRDGTGMFAFGSSEAIVGFGNVGAFYFGGDYTNSNIEIWNPVVLDIMVAGYSQSASPVYYIPEVSFSVNPAIIPTINMQFAINFSATPITKGQYGTVLEVIESPSDYTIYSVTGSSPFTVEFTAIVDADNVPANVDTKEYVWKIIEFNWDFGDGTVLTTTTPTTRHAYCGPHGTKYNVSLVADYALVKIG